GLVAQVVRAERVSVEEERAGAVEVDHRGIGDELRPRLAREALRGEEVAVPVHEAHGNRLGDGVDASRDAAREGEREAVVAHPVLEEVAEDVERIGARRDLGEEALELGDDGRPRRIEVQVRDEERARQTHSAFSITTGSTGTFSMPRMLPVGTDLILSTTSLPSTTLPKTA